MPNTQKPERRSPEATGLSLHSVFYTIQGEGPFTGRPAVFVRLAGCNIQCPGCDTEYTQGRVQTSLQQLFSLIGRAQPLGLLHLPLIVITGGEPFRQDISYLVERLLKLGFPVQIETNGTLPPSAGMPSEVVVVCSPKAGRVAEGLKPFISAYKYVVEDGFVNSQDGLPTSVLGNGVSPARPHAGFVGPVYVSPMDSQDTAKNIQNTQAAVASCLKFGYILNLQVHKLVGLP